VTDGVNLLSGTRIISGSVKVSMSDVLNGNEFRVALDGMEVRGIDVFCTDPIAQNYEYNFRLPKGAANGPHEIRISLGRRRFAPVPIEIAQ
jgi:hypothetical protein